MRKRKTRILMMAAALVVAVGLAAGLLLAGAVWREEEAVHIVPDEIESSTLVIGAHLIHLSALTDSIYEVAQTSAEDSGQNRIYYKSELAGGTWFDITTASTLADITTGGSPVGKEVIEALFFTHHTRSDGVTYDLRTQQPVAIHDIVDPYDLETMPELFPLKTQYDTIKETQAESEAGEEKLERIEQILTLVVINEQTIQCDKNLSGLEAYYNVLKENDGGGAEMGVVQAVMDAVDAERRVYVMRTVEAALNEYTEELTSITDSTDEEGNTVAGAAGDTTLQAAVNDSLANVKNSLIENEGKMLDPGTTVLSNAYYTLANQLISDASAPNHSACDADVARMIHLDNIKNGVISDREGELELLDGTLLGQATGAYTGVLGAGINADYRAAVAQNAAQALLNSIANANTSTANTARNELEFLINARSQRVSNEEGMAFIDQRLELASGWYASVPGDAFRAGANSTIDAHIEFLTDLRRSLELANGGNELDALMAEKADLQTQLMSALDDNDLAGAQELEEAIAAIDGQMDNLQNENSAQMNRLSEEISNLEEQMDQANAAGNTGLASQLAGQIGALKSEQAALGAGMSDGSLGALVADLKRQGLDAVADGSSDGAESAANALGDMLSMDHGLVFPALMELHAAMAAQRDLNGDSSFDGAIAGIEEDILNNADAYAAALRDEKTAEDLEGIAEDFFADDEPSLLDSGAQAADLGWDGDGVVYLAALQMYHDETGSGAALSLLTSVSRRQTELGNPLVFPRCNDVGFEYLPLTVLRAHTGMRYVWNENETQGTLARGATYYEFTNYSDAVIRGKTEQDVDYMTRTAKYQNGLHIYEEYTLAEFGAEALYLTGADYGVLISPEIQSQAEELFALFLS